MGVINVWPWWRFVPRGEYVAYIELGKTLFCVIFIATKFVGGVVCSGECFRDNGRSWVHPSQNNVWPIPVDTVANTWVK